MNGQLNRSLPRTECRRFPNEEPPTPTPLRGVTGGVVWALLLYAAHTGATQPNLPAVIRIDTAVVATDIEPLGACMNQIAGGANLATNNFIDNSGFEPIAWRMVVPLSAAGDNWFEYDIDGGPGHYNLMWTGFGNGAEVRFYRLTDAAGNPLPYREDSTWLDVATADHVEFLGVDTVALPSVRFPKGGWIANEYQKMLGRISSDNANVTDPRALNNGDTIYCVITAVDADGNESAYSNEVMVVPSASSAAGPCIYATNYSTPPAATAGGSFNWRLQALGGASPYSWSVIEGSLPEGLTLDTASGAISGRPTATPGPTRFTVQARDDNGSTATHVCTINPTNPASVAGNPAAPSNLRGTAGNGFVALSWDASTSGDVVRYNLYRSDTPLARQEERIYLKNGGLGLRRYDHAFIYLKSNYIPRETSAPPVRDYWTGDRSGLFLLGAGGVTARRVPHPGTLPADMDYPGETCLEVTATRNATSRIAEVHFAPPDHSTASHYTQLTPGAPYRVEVWLRQEGLGNDGAVRFMFSGSETYSAANQETPWMVTGEWRRYTYDFEGPPYPNDPNPYHISVCLEYRGPGKLWVDNWVLYKNDAKHENRPFSPGSTSLDEFMASSPTRGKKPILRTFGLGVYSNSDIDAFLSFHGSAAYNRSWHSGIGAPRHGTLPEMLYWCYETGQSPATRAVPYLTITEEYTDNEWKAIVEYLGVPYDPAADSPQSKPYAYKRYQHRNGNGSPWTEEFREIVLGYGNETWHQGAGGYGWHGFGRPNAVFQGGKEYGLYAKYMFEEVVMSMPAWATMNLGAKIKFSLNGGYRASREHGYGWQAAMEVPTMGCYLEYNNYVGAKPETGDPRLEGYSRDGMQQTLLAPVVHGMEDHIQECANIRDTLKTMGVESHMAACEGGPTGYIIGEFDETSERYGKSLGMGVACLDVWLLSTLNGWKHQCFNAYSGGNGWSSHTPPEAGGFRAHPAWLALALRNRYANGDEMVRTTVEGCPTLALEGSEVPLVKAYTIREDGAYYVFVLSRKLEGRHSGADFGDGYTPTSLHLPFGTPQRIMLYKLVGVDGNPISAMAHNRDRLRVVVDSSEIDGGNFAAPFVINENTGGGAGGMPPGTVFLYAFVLDTAALTVTSGEPVMTSVTNGGEPRLSVRSWESPAHVVEHANQNRPEEVHATSTGVDAGTRLHDGSEPMMLANVAGSIGVALPPGMDVPDANAMPIPGFTSEKDMPHESPYARPAEQVGGDEAEIDSTWFIWEAPENALEAARVSATDEDAVNRAAGAIDRDLRTRWAPAGKGAPCLTVDLGRVRTLSGAALLWYTREETTAKLIVSTSTGGADYLVAADEVVSGRGGNETLCAFDPVSARYVRFEVQGDSGRVLSVYEVAALGGAGGDKETAAR